MLMLLLLLLLLLWLLRSIVKLLVLRLRLCLLVERRVLVVLLSRSWPRIQMLLLLLMRMLLVLLWLLLVICSGVRRALACRSPGEGSLMIRRVYALILSQRLLLIRRMSRPNGPIRGWRLFLLARVKLDPGHTVPDACLLVLAKSIVSEEIVANTTLPALGAGVKVKVRILELDPLVNLLEGEAIRRRREHFVDEDAIVLGGLLQVCMRIIFAPEL
jgi:hypothetical protein